MRDHKYPTALAGRFGRTVLAIVSVSLAGASALQYERESRLYAAAEQLGRDLDMEARSPGDLRMSRLEPAGDLAADVVVQAALRDVQPGAPAENRGEFPHSPRTWTPSRTPRQLNGARELMLDAIELRPGWAYHQFLLGRAVEAAGRQDKRPGHVLRSELWIRPLVEATAAAPGLEAAWVALGVAYIENWSNVSASDRAAAPRVLQHAFRDPTVVSRNFSKAAGILGTERAMALLPDTTQALDAATQAFFQKGDLANAAKLLVRFENAERRERAAGLVEIEKLHRLGDSDGLWAACVAWSSSYPAADGDDRVGRSQTARVLELWPSERAGSWANDPRGKVVLFFLRGRELDVKGEVLARTLDSLSGVPDPVRARVQLIAGDRAEAEQIASRSGDADDPEWQPYFLQLARADLKVGRPREAALALEHLDARASEECEALLVRREVAHSLGDRRELDAANEKLTSIRQGFLSSVGSPTSSRAALSLCVDREWARGRALSIEVQVASSAVVTYGWDEGRSGVLFIPGDSSTLRVPLTDLSGGREFSVRSLAGGPLRGLRGAVTSSGR